LSFKDFKYLWGENGMVDNDEDVDVDAMWAIIEICWLCSFLEGT